MARKVSSKSAKNKKKGTSAARIADRNIVNFKGDWGAFEFYIKRSSIIGVKDLNITVSIETENKTASDENYTTRKHYNPAEITLTGIFSRALGVKDVKAKSWELMNIIRLGRKGYLYCGSEKLIAPMMMGTNAKATQIEIGPDGKWWYCEVAITLKQCEKYGGGTSGSKSHSGGGSKKRKSTKSGGTTQPAKKIAGAAVKIGKGAPKTGIKDAIATKKGGAAASIKSKLQASGKTQRATGGGGTWRAQTK